MSEVAVRLSELHNASEQLRQSAQRLQIAVDTVMPIIEQSMLDALPRSENILLYQSQKAKITGIPAQITQFAEKLEHAAIDIEAAVETHATNSGISVVHFYAPKRVRLANSITAAVLLGHYAADGTTPGITKMTLDDYVSRRNQPLYDELQTTRSQLKDRSHALGVLVNQRNTISEDLTALKNRMVSYDASMDIEHHPRVSALQTQLDDLDRQIETVQADVDRLQTDAHRLTVRLDRVAPAAGAELNDIVNLEGAENPVWMKTSTFGCVNHVVDKMPLPNGVPRDAVLWDDAARQLPQYGISWGDTPLEGSVLQLDPSHPYADNQYGHVLYVERVEESAVWVTDNLHPDTPVKLSDLTTQLQGDDMRYLYFPWHTKA